MTVKETIKSEVAPPRLDTYFWAIVLIWAGLVFGADSLGYLPQVGEAGAWSWAFLGAGVVGFLLSLYSMSSPSYAKPITWDWIWAFVFLVIGVAGFLAIVVPWWLILIVIGFAILFSALRRRE